MSEVTQHLYPQAIAVAPVRHAQLQRFYLFLGISIFASVVYFCSIKPHSMPERVAVSNHEHRKQGTGTAQTHVSNNCNSVMGTQPNILLILTDDQDIVLAGADHMPKTSQLLAQEGVSFSNAFVTSPLCCPSRSSILTGRYVHNHRAVNNSLEGHCSDSYWQTTHEKQTLAVCLHSAGYRTFFSGKYLNQYGTPDAGGVAHVPPGWDWWHGLVGNSRYYNYSLSVNGTEERHGEHPDEDYLTDVIWKQAKEFLSTVEKRTFKSCNESEAVVLSDDSNSSRIADSDSIKKVHRPFFMMLSTPASHAPFTPKPQYSSNFTHLRAPRSKNFNVKNNKSKHWLLRLGEQPLSDRIISKVDEVFRNRLRTLLTVDDMIGDLASLLIKKDLLQDTFIVFTSDNGYHLGQFSMPLDKREPYEFDVRVPLIVRGPGVPSGVTMHHPTINVDLAPTLLDVAGVAVPDYMDGVSVKALLLGGQQVSKNVGMRVRTNRQSDNTDAHLEVERSNNESYHSLDVTVPRDSLSITNYSYTSIFNTNEKENFYETVSLANYQSADKNIRYDINSSNSLREHLLLRRSMLIEHSGEGQPHQHGACSTIGAGLQGCSPDYDCKCSDSWNNTYACVRQVYIAGRRSEYNFKEDRGKFSRMQDDVMTQVDVNVRKRNGDYISSRVNGLNEDTDFSLGKATKDVLFCVFEDSENFIEYYNLLIDKDQLHNAIDELEEEEVKRYKKLLAQLSNCAGATCNIQ